MNYLPEQGDIIWVDFDPTKGHEMQKKRPALVITSTNFNRVTHFCGVCPITSTKRSYPTNYVLEQTKTTGSVVTSQFRTIDFTAVGRSVSFIEKLPKKDFFIIAQHIANAFEFPFE